MKNACYENVYLLAGSTHHHFCGNIPGTDLANALAAYTQHQPCGDSILGMDAANACGNNLLGTDLRG